MKVICVMCNVVVREFAPLDKDDPIGGICGNCKVKSGSTRRDIDPNASSAEQAGRNAAEHAPLFSREPAQ